MNANDTRLVIPLQELRREDVAFCGGKSSSLGEMIGELGGKGVRVPGGFSTTAKAYQNFLLENGLHKEIYSFLEKVDVNVSKDLASAGQQVRDWIKKSKFSEEFIEAIRLEIEKLAASGADSLAVRSSATAEDLPDASFAGQQETILNVPVNLEAVLSAIRQVMASLFGDRAIAYRVQSGFDHSKVSLCACVQQMVRSDKAVAGVMFSVDSECGYSGVVPITAVWGLGELAVSGANAHEYIVGKPTRIGGPFSVLRRHIGDLRQKMIFSSKVAHSSDGGVHFTELVPTTKDERSRFCLNDNELKELAGFAVIIEQHYSCPMDMEWAKSGVDGKLYIVQARPLTVNKKVGDVFETYHLQPGQHIKLMSGRAIGRRISSGRVQVLADSSPGELAKVQEGDVLVADMTDPNHVPAMRKASAIITRNGSPQCHAAIIAREFGIPAIVACPEALTLHDGDMVTVCCSEGTTGNVYKGDIPFETKRTQIGILPDLKVKLKMNVGDPSQAIQAAMLPNRGVGLARQEFIVGSSIGIHPQACLDYEQLSESLQLEIRQKIVGYKDPAEFYVQKLAEGIGLIARAFGGERVIIRLSDFKTNEYCDLIGGSDYEPEEANPMLGFRGAARYLDPKFQKCFELECRALKIVREDMGLTNVDIMVPFVRTLDEGRKVMELLAKNGLVSTPGEDGLHIGMMCELPSNVVLADEFAKIFDFASIGSNDLTQLTIGADRDSGCNFGDERDPAVKRMIEMAVSAWNAAGKPIGICGQAPSDHADYAEWLADIGIDSMSLNPDSVVDVWKRLAAKAA